MISVLLYHSRIYLKNYGIDPYSFSVAKAVRMSCSIPFYYTPVELDTRKGLNYIVDGGIVKNVSTRIISHSVNFKYPTFRFKIKKGLEER